MCKHGREWQCNWEEKTEKTEKGERKSNKNRKQSLSFNNMQWLRGNSCMELFPAIHTHSHVPRAPIPYLPLSFTRTIIYFFFGRLVTWPSPTHECISRELHMPWIYKKKFNVLKCPFVVLLEFSLGFKRWSLITCPLGPFVALIEFSWELRGDHMSIELMLPLRVIIFYKTHKYDIVFFDTINK